jgi:hypothetical protein
MEESSQQNSLNRFETLTNDEENGKIEIFWRTLDVRITIDGLKDYEMVGNVINAYNAFHNHFSLRIYGFDTP